jgi:two-component system cell cycle sensor histidine kinase/response regulator CckA
MFKMEMEKRKQRAGRRKADKELKDSEEKYRSLFEKSSDAIYITSRAGKLLDFNRAARDLFGYSEEELRDLDTAVLYVNPEDRFVFQQTIDREGAVKDYPLVFRRKDGRQMTCLLTSSVKRDRLGKIVGYQGIMRDISEKLKLEAQLQQAQKMETVGRLAGGVAHDFNNILTSILGYAELGIRRLDPENPAIEYLQVIREAGEQAANLTRRLLAFSRKQVLAMRVVCLSAVVINMGKMLARIIGEDIRLDFHVQATRNILADQSQVEQVLMNLAVNARDAMPSGGVLTIDTFDVSIDDAFSSRFAGLHPGDFVMLSVTDDGEGIARDQLDFIFEPFYTTKKEGHGTGLGLSMVYGIVKQHNGYIYVSSEKGKGTTFRIYFPACEDDAPEKRFKPELAELKKGTETLLIVEDEASIRGLIFQILEPLGYHLIAADSGEEALSVLQTFNGTIDLLLTDLIMPGINGRQLAEKAEELFPAIKVILMSGYSDDLLQNRGVGHPVELLAKPLTPLKLAQAIRRVLDVEKDIPT